MLIFRQYLRQALVVLFLLSATSAAAQRYTCLALEGGGIRGIAYAGAYEVLEKQGISPGIQKVAGTSVGAIVGALICTGYSSEEIRKELDDLKIQTFNDGKWFFVGAQRRMRKQFGWYRGDALERWIAARMAAKTGKEHLTFGELHLLSIRNKTFKDFYATASNLSQQKLTVFCWEDFPDMEVATAVRASMSVPLYFRALTLDEKGHKTDAAHGQVFVDGGLVMNYPLGLFDSGGKVNEKVLGLKLERPEQMDYFRQSTAIAPFPINSFRTHVGALYNLTIETLARKTPMEDEVKRTIYISTEGVQPRVRRMSQKEKDLLYQSGLQAARSFFSKQ